VFGRPKKNRTLEPWELKKDGKQLRKRDLRKRGGTCKELWNNRKCCLQLTHSKQPSHWSQPPNSSTPTTPPLGTWFCEGSQPPLQTTHCCKHT